MKSKPNLFGRFSKSAILPSFAVISIFSGSPASATEWDGTGTITTDWNDNGNWVGDAGTGGSAALININSPVATISANIVATPADILVGNGAATNGRVDHTAGTAQTGNGNWMKIGQNGGTGVYNLANTAGTGGAFTGFGMGTGSLNVPGAQLRVGGGDAGAGSTGTLNINTSGTVSVGTQIRVGTQTSTGILNIDNGVINFGTSGQDSWLYVGDGTNGGAGVTGTVNMSGGTLTKTGNQHIRIGGEGANGFFNLTGGTVTNNNELQIGDGAGTHGTLAVSGSGVINTNSWVSIGRSTGTGTLNVDGGTFNKTNNGTAFIVGDGSTGTLSQTGGTINTDACEVWIGTGPSSGTYNMSGGSLNAGNWFVVGRNGNSVGVINMSGGTITKGGANDLVVGADSDSANGTIVFSGGLINVTAGSTNIGKGGGTGLLTMSNTAEFRTSQMVLGVGTGIGTVNFNGGTLKTPKLIGGGGSSTFHFNGGTIQATGDSVAFISDLTTADILAGGAIIDTQAFNGTSSQIFSGTGPLTKVGSGTLTLTGDSTHTGLTQVNDGKLVVSTRSTTLAGSFAVANGKTLGVTRRFAEESLNADSLTLGTTAATATLEINLGNFGNPYSGVGTLNVIGNLAVNANTTVNITDSFPEVGSFPLIQFGSRSGSGTITLGTLPPGVVAHLDETIDPNAIYLVITQAKLLEWDDSELTGGVWNTVNSNWNDVLTYSPAVFTTGSPVSFLDFGTVDYIDPPNPNVVIAAGGVSPGSVTFNNSTIDYNVSGTGGINGTTGLLKQGSATTTLATSNSYTGATRLEGGVLSVSTVANAGSPSGIGAAAASPSNLVLAGGTLRYTGSGASSDRGFSIAAASGLDVQGDLTLSGSVTATAGSLTKTGAGVLTLTNPGANLLGAGGDLSVNGGGLTLNGSGTQTNTGSTEIYVGAGTAAAASLILNNTSLSCTNYLALARGSMTPGAVSTCTLTNSSMNTGNLSLGYDNNVVGYSATSMLTLNDSSYITGFSKIGESSGSIATLVLNGLSTMTAVNTDVAEFNGATGTLNVKGTSTYTSNNRMQVGRDDGAHGNVVVENSGKIAVNSYASIGFGGEGHLTVKNAGMFTTTDDFSVNENSPTASSLTLQDSGIVTAQGTVFVGRGAGRTGTVTQTGGSFTGNGPNFEIGLSGTGSWLQSGGTTTAAGAVSIGRNAGSTGILTVSGTAVFNQTGPGLSLTVGAAGSGTLNIQGTATVSSLGSGGVIVSGPGGPGTVNLDGGTLLAMKLSDGGTGAGTVHLNGGVLKAGVGANTDFMNGLNSVTVDAGGAFIDTNNQTIAIAQVLANGGGGLTKTGAGVLRLNAANTYTGATVVSTGSLGGTGSVAGTLSVAAAGTIAPGAGGVGTFTAGNTTIAGTFACDVDGATADLLAAGTLNVAGATLTVNAINPLAGPIVIATSSSAIVGTFASVPVGYSVSYSGNKITLSAAAGTPYSNWAATNITAINAGADASEGGDPDGDGKLNIAEFALNSNPLSGANSGKVVGKIANVGGSPRLVLSLPVRGAPTFSGATQKVSVSVDGVTYTIQGSVDITAWNRVVTEVLGADKTAIEAGLPALDSGWSYRTFQTPGPVAGNPRDFLRAIIKN